MSDLDTTQRETAETADKVRTAIDAAKRYIKDAAEKTRDLFGEEALSPGYAAACMARLAPTEQERARLMIAAEKEEITRDLATIEVKRAVRVKPTRQMV